MEVDLVIEEEKCYYYENPVLRFWVAYTSQGVKVDAFPRWEDLEGLIADLSERSQRVSSQPGRAPLRLPESEVRKLLHELAGKNGGGGALRPGWTSTGA